MPSTPRLRCWGQSKARRGRPEECLHDIMLFKPVPERVDALGTEGAKNSGVHRHVPVPPRLGELAAQGLQLHLRV